MKVYLVKISIDGDECIEIYESISKAYERFCEFVKESDILNKKKFKIEHQHGYFYRAISIKNGMPIVIYVDEKDVL